MMRGMLLKIFYEVRWPLLFFSAGLATIMALLTTLLPKVLADVDKVFERLPFVKPLVTALLGVDPGNELTAQMTQAFLWVHPTVLTIIWAHEVMYCTRMPAAEVDRGTADFLLGLPVSRWRLYFSETIGWLVSGIFLLSVGFWGHWAASDALQPDMQPGPKLTLFVMLNLAGVYMAVGGMAFLVSACSDRRNRAIGIVFGVLLMSFLLNFLAQFWEPAQTVSFLSIMEYYRPAVIIQSGNFPRHDLTILLAIGGITWLTGGFIFRHRSICTV